MTDKKVVVEIKVWGIEDARREIVDSLTQSELRWFAERMERTGSGLVTCSSYSVKKWQKLTGCTCKVQAKEELIFLFGDWA